MEMSVAMEYNIKSLPKGIPWPHANSINVVILGKYKKNQKYNSILFFISKF